jgi:hypothetical protein
VAPNVACDTRLIGLTSGVQTPTPLIYVFFVRFA